MAGYRTHITVSGCLGVGYGAASTMLAGFTPVQASLAGALTWVAGMLPDLDSDTGKPVREIFSLLAAFAPFAMMGHLLDWSRGDHELTMLLSVCVYATIRFGGQLLLNHVSVHRGMFHSIPAMIIAAEIAFLAFKSDSLLVKALMAGGVAAGFFSHLLLDEIYAVEWTGVRLKLNKFAGSAIKLVGNKFVPNIVTYSLLMVLTYATLVQSGFIDAPATHGRPTEMHRAASGDMPDFN